MGKREGGEEEKEREEDEEMEMENCDPILLERRKE